MTRYQLHVKKWSNCTRCPLHECRNKVVLARGSVPCDVLMVGEAPGQSENVLGTPFVGPAGHLLNQILDRAFTDYPSLSYALTNVVACIPLGEDGNKVSEPGQAEIRACNPRLNEFIELCSPRLIVRVGQLAKDYVDVPEGVKTCDIVHPAHIIRAPVANQGLMIQRCVVNLEQALEEL